MKPTVLLLAALACRPELFAGQRPLPPFGADSGADSAEADADADGDADGDTDGDSDGDADPDCGFDYAEQFGLPGPPGTRERPAWRAQGPLGGPDPIAWAEPAPPGFHRLPPPMPDLTMPDYEDDMPLFDRAGPWEGAERCFETPGGAQWLDEEQAWALYLDIAERTTGVAAQTGSGRRSVLGIRGAYPGTFAWHGDAPNLFNDTLVLLWQDGEGKHVRELPVNTGTGAYDFGTDSSSSLRPNRRYTYQDGWHRGYNALSIDESGYHVQDDTNANGHWDSDRNGWLPPDDGADHERTGSGHNIHMASVDAPLGAAQVENWSAGCQTIPGMANWEQFITDAWEEEGQPVQYFLVDARDIEPTVWEDCTPDGTHACPFRIEGFPYRDDRSTEGLSERSFDAYNCSTADEGGPEVVYLFTTDAYGTLTAAVDCVEPVDVDVHLLEGDDPDACLARDHTDFSYAISPGRYLIVVDTWVDGAGEELSGGYTLTITLD